MVAAAEVAKYVVTAIFALAGAAKLFNGPPAQQLVKLHGYPAWLARSIGGAEVGIAGALWFAPLPCYFATVAIMGGAVFQHVEVEGKPLASIPAVVSWDMATKTSSQTQAFLWLGREKRAS